MLLRIRGCLGGCPSCQGGAREFAYWGFLFLFLFVKCLVPACGCYARGTQSLPGQLVAVYFGQSAKDLKTSISPKLGNLLPLPTPQSTDMLQTFRTIPLSTITKHVGYCSGRSGFTTIQTSSEDKAKLLGLGEVYGCWSRVNLWM